MHGKIIHFPEMTQIQRIYPNVFMGVMMIPPPTILLVCIPSWPLIWKAINSYWGLILTLVAFDYQCRVYVYELISSIPRALDG